MRSVLLLILSFVMLQSLNAQDCNAIFKEVTDKVKQDREAASDNGFSMTFRVRVTMDDGKIHGEDLEVAMKGKKYKYTSKSMSLYQDEKTSIVITPTDKSILITKSDGINPKTNQFERLVKMQDSIANYFVVESCKREWGLVDRNTGYYKMVLSPKAKMKGMGVNSIVYAIAVDKMEVRKINIYYDPTLSGGIKDYEMVITNRNDGAIQYPFMGTAIGIVMDEGKLKSPYNNFSVVDKRN